MQRDPLQLGALHDQPVGITSVPEKSLATGCVRGVRYPAGNLTQRVPDSGDRVALCAIGSEHDP